MTKRKILTVLALGAVLATVSACGKSDTATPANAGSATVITIKPTDIVRGNPNATVTMVEYASMTCPHCSRWQREVMPKLYEKYIKTGKVRYILREFPLDGAARVASALARCLKGEAFFSFIDHLFLNQAQWMDTNGDGRTTQEEVTQGLIQMGRVAGMNQQQVEACMNDPKNLAIVDDNLQEAQSLYNVQGTPTFILGDTVHRAEWAWEDLDAKLKSMLPKS